jgi:hypothetical protein
MRTVTRLGLVAAAFAAAAIAPHARQQPDLQAAMAAEAAPPNAIWLDSLDLSKMVQRRLRWRRAAKARGFDARWTGSRHHGRSVPLFYKLSAGCLLL